MRGFQRSTFLFELDSLVDWLFDELHAQDQTASRREDRGKKRILIYERSVHNFCGKSFLWKLFAIRRNFRFDSIHSRERKVESKLI